MRSLVLAVALMTAPPALARDYSCETVSKCNSASGCESVGRGGTFRLRMSDDGRSGSMDLDGRRYTLALQSTAVSERVYLVTEGRGHVSLATLSRDGTLTLGGLVFPRGGARAMTLVADCRGAR